MDTHENIFEWRVEKSFRSGTHATRQLNSRRPRRCYRAPPRLRVQYNADNFETSTFRACRDDSSAAVERVALLRVQEQQTGQTFARGSGDALEGLATGYVFSLEQHPRADLNTRYLIRSTSISMSNGSTPPVTAAAPVSSTSPSRLY